MEKVMTKECDLCGEAFEVEDADSDEVICDDCLGDDDDNDGEFEDED